jgi:hypothetical protein
MIGKQTSASLRDIVISASLLSSGIASAHVVEQVWEAGFSRIKLASRGRAWRDDPAALQALASAPVSHLRPGRAANAHLAPERQTYG